MVWNAVTSYSGNTLRISLNLTVNIHGPNN